MNKKNKIIIAVIAVILLVIALIIYFSSDKTVNKKIIKNFTDIGFVNHSNSFLYSKQLSNINLEQHNNNVKNKIESTYEILYFNSNTYELTKDKISYNNGITKNFTPTYDYTNRKVIYNYRINFNNTNILVEGSFDNETKTFVCNSNFAYNIDMTESKQDICNKLKIEIENFSYEAKKYYKK